MAMIPVRRIREDGSECTDPFRGMPCIDLKFSFEKSTLQANGNFLINGLFNARALIDTGADFNHIDAALIPPNQQPVEEIRILGVNGVTVEPNYEIAFYFAETSLIHNTGATAITFPTPRPYQIILGRKFLQSCRFTYDAHNGIQDFHVFENPMAV